MQRMTASTEHMYQIIGHTSTADTANFFCKDW